MGKQEIINIIRTSKPEIEARYGVMRMGLFGSYVREQQRKKSDIDILVSFDRDIDLFEFIDLREFLEARLHHKSISSWKRPSNPPSAGASSPRWSMYKGREIADYLEDI